jgi:hypothetical protein
MGMKQIMLFTFLLAFTVSAFEFTDKVHRICANLCQQQ